ncbi:MAG: hypothetical protein NT077_00865 [Candidatus Taylorbacteria bacterium]|nr:hypothetical protein [Candidatus Taylorbacteria bacterium]
MKLRNLLISLFIIILLAAAGWAYWYFLMGPTKIPAKPGDTGTPGGFQPINRPGGNTGGTGGTGNTGTTTGNIPTGIQQVKIPSLRLLSGTPVGGYSASTTASTTNIRWVDRGRGNVYQASSNSLTITTLSNTVVPKIFASVWNKNLTSFIASIFENTELVPITVYSELIPRTNKTAAATTTPSTSSAPFDLRGKSITGNVIGYAASPDRSQLFTMMNENGNGVGYVSSFSATSPTRLFTTPLTEVNVSWPSDNIIAITTKGSTNHSGFLYFVNPKTGVWTKVLGPLPGLSTRVNQTGKYIIYSATGKNNDVMTGIYSMAAGTTTEAVIRTLADKCTWGKFYKELVYCGVPSQSVSGRYPDDWYLGTLSTIDKIWQVNAITGEARLVSSLIDQSDRILNVFNLETDPKDMYLFFMNKNDLSLWSLDLVKSN